MSADAENTICTADHQPISPKTVIYLVEKCCDTRKPCIPIPVFVINVNTKTRTVRLRRPSGYELTIDVRGHFNDPDSMKHDRKLSCEQEKTLPIYADWKNAKVAARAITQKHLETISSEVTYAQKRVKDCQDEIDAACKRLDQKVSELAMLEKAANASMKLPVPEHPFQKMIDQNQSQTKPTKSSRKKKSTESTGIIVIARKGETA